MINIRIKRFDPEKDKEPHFESYEVEEEEGMVVLDAVHWIENHIDPTLSVRWNCKAARCGSCSAEINGLPRLMCKTRIDTMGENITIEPMRAYPVVKDLVSDVSLIWEIAKMIPPFTLKEGQEKPLRMYQIDITRSK